MAVQTISASIADSLEFLKEDILHEEFIEAATTIRFIRTFDKVYDLKYSEDRSNFNIFVIFFLLLK